MAEGSECRWSIRALWRRRFFGVRGVPKPFKKCFAFRSDRDVSRSAQHFLFTVCFLAESGFAPGRALALGLSRTRRSERGPDGLGDALSVAVSLAKTRGRATTLAATRSGIERARVDARCLPRWKTGLGINLNRAHTLDPPWGSFPYGTRNRKIANHDLAMRFQYNVVPP